jgi:hypothetical protein
MQCTRLLLLLSQTRGMRKYCDRENICLMVFIDLHVFSIAEQEKVVFWIPFVWMNECVYVLCMCCCLAPEQLDILRSYTLFKRLFVIMDHLPGLEVRVPGYRSKGPGFDSRRYQIFWEIMGLERGPLSLVRINWGAPWPGSSGCGLENRN